MDMGFSFPLAIFGGVVATTVPGDVSVSLVSPGPAGTITGGTFDQLANQLALDGDVNIANLLLNADFDLENVVVNSVDFTNIGISQSGNVFTISGNFAIAQEVDALGTIIALDGEGQFEASGIKPVPEPGSTMVLIGIGTVLLTRRRR